MAIFKCKMCGGTLEINNETVATCEYCGTQQTLPKTSDDVVANLFNRANNLRLKCEFDKASQIYEKIVAQDDSEAEAHWGIVLCKYGIEYVEDPKTKKRIPTCHRTLYEAVTTDADYLAAIDYSDAAQQQIYESEARAIDRIQKDILAIVKNEKPFDVFICYKETDDTGKRTIDSIIANDIYHQLTQEGFKVFYAAITLEDKLGQEYEPYIFAALNSAKVMLVLGTKPEYYSAVWVKNEWSRFLHLMKTNRSKLLIPCYRDMDAYDLPEEFAHLQAQDMSKIGFINDVVRGIKKVAQTAAPKPTVVKETVVTGGPTNTAPLLKRAFLFLEDEDWSAADEYCEKVLDLDPECAEAYLGKLMAEFEVKNRESLVDLDQPFDNHNIYQKAMRFADANLRTFLGEAIATIRSRNEENLLQEKYNQALLHMNAAQSESKFLAVANLFAELGDYQDSAQLQQRCLEKAEMAAKDSQYACACQLMDIPKPSFFRVNENDINIKNLVKAINIFSQLNGWKDSEEKIQVCKAKIQEIKNKLEEERLEKERRDELARQEALRIAKRNKKIKGVIAIVIAALIIIAIAAYIIINAVIPSIRYDKAATYVGEGQYQEAVTIYEQLGDYKDSADRLTETIYLLASAQVENKEYDQALESYERIDKYKDVLDEKNSTRYLWASSLLKKKKYQEAYEIFDKILEYKDSKKKWKQSGYGYAQELMKDKKYEDAYYVLNVNGDYKKSKDLRNQCCSKIAKQHYAEKDYFGALQWLDRTSPVDRKSKLYQDSCYNYAVCQKNIANYSTAITYFEKVPNYKDSKTQIKATKYSYILAYYSNNDDTTYKYLKELKSAGYKDCAKLYKELYAWKLDIKVNDSENDETSDMASISKYNYWYFHISLSGGEPDAEIQIKCIGYFPGGDTHTTKWDDKWQNGYSGTCWFYYETPLYGYEGTFRLKVFDGKGNFLAEKSVKITG